MPELLLTRYGNRLFAVLFASRSPAPSLTRPLDTSSGAYACLRPAAAAAGILTKIGEGDDVPVLRGSRLRVLVTHTSIRDLHAAVHGGQRCAAQLSYLSRK
jgi:hypothetical protein